MNNALCIVPSLCSCSLSALTNSLHLSHPSSVTALLSSDKGKAARISFELPVYEVWEDQGPVKLRLKANKPLDMKGQQDVYIKPLEIIPVSARGKAHMYRDMDTFQL